MLRKREGIFLVLQRLYIAREIFLHPTIKAGFALRNLQHDVKIDNIAIEIIRFKRYTLIQVELISVCC